MAGAGTHEKLLVTHSEDETARLGASLARALLPARPAFVRLIGQLGAGKSAFARGFIRQWVELSGEPAPSAIASPTFNIVKTYGTVAPLAHLDLYRLKSMRELEQLGFEHYFFEHACCLVEWLEQIPEALASMPGNAVVVELAFGSTPAERQIRVRSQTEISLKP